MRESIQDIAEIINNSSIKFDYSFYLSVISISIAILALILPIIREYLKERKRLKNLEKYVYYILEELLDPINKKVKNLKELSNSIKNTETRNFGFADSSTLLIEVFNKISHQDLHMIFIQNKRKPLYLKIKHFKNIVDIVDSFDKQNKIDQKNFFQFMKDLRRYEKQFNENVDAIFRLFDLYVSTNKRENIHPSNDPFLSNFDKILFNWRQDEQYSLISKTKEMMLDPLKNECVKYSTDNRAIEILPYIIKCNYAYIDLENLKNLYSNIFYEAATKLEEKMVSLKNALDFFIN